jgi:hypothetical protein
VSGKCRKMRLKEYQPKFHQNELAMRNTADVTGGKPIAVQSISGVSVSLNRPLEHL